MLKTQSLHLLLLLAFGLSLGSCIRSKPERIDYNPAFDAYFSAFTHGVVSKNAVIRLRFAQEMVNNLNSPLPKDLLKFSPALTGELRWEDKRTLAFHPNQALPSGSIVTAKLQLHQLIKDLPEDLRVFPFQFKVKDQWINISPQEALALEAEGKEWWKIQGTVTVADAEPLDNIAKLVQLQTGGQALPLRWESIDGHTFRFVADSVQRSDKPYAVLATWNGGPLGADKSEGKEQFNVPVSGTFAHTNTYKYSSPDQHIVLEFSQWLDPFQNLEGLITLNGKSAQYSIEGNRIKVYSQQKLLGAVKVNIAANVRSTKGLTLSAPSTTTLTFSDEKPAVRWIGKGNIIPQSKSMPIHFQSVNLNAVDVRVIKIKEDNILQFFQVNQIDENNELKRVGTVVMEKKIALDKTQGLNLTEWTSHSLDLASLLTPEPGAIYEIAIGFRPAYVLYNCASKEANENPAANGMVAIAKDWDKPNFEYSYWDDYGQDYEYEDRENPCKAPYYHSERAIYRNVLGSDLGILAKRGDNGSLYVVNNLQTTAPMEGVTLEFYDFHQELIGTAQTDKEGMARPTLAKTPFFLIAKSGKQRGYLRLDDGSAMSFSRFDVQGTTYTKGLKGFIYGERGVWRPGDEIFLNFILEDRDNVLPANHPVNLELKDPRGATVLRRTAQAGVNGFYNFTFSTAENAITGNYTATVKVGGASFSKTLKIETIKPNRLKVLWDENPTLTAGKKQTLGLQSAWLHGAAAKGLKAKVDATLKPGSTQFKQHPGYIFFDPASTYSPQTVTIFEDKLNDEGKSKVSLDFKTEEPMPCPMHLHLATQVFEPGGDFSIDQTAMTFHPYSMYLGIRLPQGDQKRNMLLTDTKHKVQIISVNTQGEVVPNQKVTVKLYKLEWKWWFDKDRNEVPGWRGDISAQEIQTAELRTDAKGNAAWDLEIKYPEWGRYLVRVCSENGHCTGDIVYLDWPGWAGRSNDKDPEGAAMLELSSSKEVYNTGEEVVVNIPTGFAGRALVSIESGSKILQAQWVEAQKGTVQYRFKTSSDMTPNVYVHVTLLQPHAQTKNDLPIRMYGVLPIRVEDANTRLEPIVQTAEEYKPMESFSVTVSERKGGPMAYTIAVVDEGLLDLTKFKTPNPWDVFYQRMALGVKTWDLYGNVLAAYGGEVKSLLSIGGDAAILDPNSKKRQDRFKPVILYAGPFELKKGEKKTHEFKMPNYVGSVRVMVIAAEPKTGAYGQAEKTVPVKQGLMVLGSIPRVASVGESMRIPATVFVNKEDIKNVEVNIETNNLFQVVNGNKRSLTFNKTGEDIAFFELKTGDRIGEGKIKISVKSGSYQAFYETDIAIRYPNASQTTVSAFQIENGQTGSKDYLATGLAGSNSGILELSTIPPINLGNRLKYLIQYPYGCVEQTTSAAFPQLYVGKLMDLNEEQKAKVDKHIQAAIQRLQTYQLNNGAMAYWPGSGPDDYSTSYVGHFLIEAQKAGYTLPNGMMDKWLSYQSKMAQNWNQEGKDPQAFLSQAYRLYVLALAGKPDMSAMNRFKALAPIAKEPAPVRWHLAAAYHLAGQKEVASQIAAKASLSVMTFTPMDAFLTYGSPLRDQALMLQVMSMLGQRDQAAGLVASLSDKLSSNDWLSTQETAQALIAMSQYVGLGENRVLNFEYKIGNGDWVKASSNKAIWQLELQGDQKQTVQVRNNSGGILFGRISQMGIPAAEKESELSQGGLSMSIVYKNVNGEKLDPKSIAQGTEFMAEVVISNKGNRDLYELSLNQVFPAGWELINTRITGRKAGGDAPDYQDFRDDRAFTFFKLPKGKSKTFNVILNAAYLGKYYLPASTVEAMYDKNIQARSKGQWVEVVAKPNK